jgi:hypothetical protein
MTPSPSAASALLLLAVVVTLGYLASCALAPFRACRRCDGTGRLSGLLGGIQFCPRCDGTGLRLRLGRRVWNALRRLYRDNDR